MAVSKVTRDDVEVEDVVCHQLKIAAQAILKDFVQEHPEFAGFAHNAKMQLNKRALYQLDRVAEGLVAQLSSWVLQASHPEKGYLTFEYKVPTTWFDHLKQHIKYNVRRPRWVDYRVWAWLMGKFTVKLTLKTMTKDYVKNVNVCPHSNTEFPDPTHIRFLMVKSLPVGIR